MWHRKISNFPLDCHTSEIHGNVLPLMSILQKNLLPTLSWGHGTERCEHGGWPGVGNDIHTKHLVKFPPQLICCQLTGSSCEHRGGFPAQRGNKLDNVEVSTVQWTNHSVPVWVRDSCSWVPPLTLIRLKDPRTLKPHSYTAPVCSKQPGRERGRTASPEQHK